ncbi:MAG: cation:proton antiporter [Phycisphaerales bacterium]
MNAIAPMLLLAEATGDRPVVVDLLLMLLAAGLVGLAARYIRLSTIPAFLMTGAIIGPTALGLISGDQSISGIVQVATILLMFTIGLHMDPSELRGGGMVSVLAIGVISTAGVVLVLWPILIVLLGGGSASVWPALAVAMAISMSSTAVIVRILQEQRLVHRLIGRICIAVSIAQDLLSLAMLALLPVLALWAGQNAAQGGQASTHTAFLLPAAWPELAKYAAGIVLMAVYIAAARVALPRLMLVASAGRAGEIPLVIASGAGLGTAVFAAGLGFSPELGAFVAGFLLAGTSAKHQLAGQLMPMRDLFMAVFFTAVGLKLDLGVVRDEWMLILALSVAVIVVKFGVIALTSWALGATATVSMRSSLLLAQAGEFTIVLLSMSMKLKLVDDIAGAAVIATVIISLCLSPVLFGLGPKLARWTDRIPVNRFAASASLREAQQPAATPKPAAEGEAASGDAATADASAQANPAATPAPSDRVASHVIIAGFGVVGRSLADQLEVANVPFCIVDLNRVTIDTQRRLGRQAIYGDISSIEVLEPAGLDRADAVILTVPDDEAVMRACEQIRGMRPDVYIAARTSFLSKAMTAMQLGADHVTVEEVATAQVMAKQVIEGLRSRARSAAATGAAAAPRSDHA